MKLHLPVQLYRAVASVLFAVPFALNAAYVAPTSITIPSGYTSVRTDSLSDITAYSQVSTDVAFRLLNDMSVSGLSSALMSGGGKSSWYFTSNSAWSLRNITFSNATSTIFEARWYGDVEFSQLKKVEFSDNICAEESRGPIIKGKIVTFEGNEEASFRNNEQRGDSGGVMYGSIIRLENNKIVTFEDNYLKEGYHGGAAILSSGTVELRGNDDVIFNGNTLSVTSTFFHGYATGGAIYASSYNVTVTLSGNGDVTFSGNTAFSGGEAAGSQGGAISASRNVTVTLSGNGDVTFSGNTAFATGKYGYASGGAIYADEGTVTLSGNGDVLFEKNAEVSKGTYRLRSIYVDGGTLNLSASEGKKIEFRDSIYSSGTVKLNEDYTDAEGVTHKQMGDIIFTGATTEDDLIAVKKAHLLAQNPNADVSNLTVTADEILNSRTSIVKSITHLYGGRLRIEEGAVYQGKGITVHTSTDEDCTTTLLVKDAKVDQTGHDITLQNRTMLQVSGQGEVIANNINVAEGSMVKVAGGSVTATMAMTGGKVSGSGAFGAISMTGGILVVGNSPGVQSYTGAADLQGGKVVFSVAGSEVATEERVGWSSGTYSTMEMNGNALTFGSEVNIEIAFGGDALVSALKATDDVPMVVELAIAQNIGNILEYTQEVLAQLAAQTTFIVTDEVEGIGGNITLTPGSSLADMVKSYSYSLSGNTLSLSVTMAGNGEGLSAVPEPTTATLSLLGLAGLMLRRRRK